MTTPANDIAASACQRLATWLGSDSAEAAAGLSALPVELATHVGECLSCYRFATAWRELPKRETELRALLVDSELETEAYPWNDAFWRQLPARVYREVNHAGAPGGQLSRTTERGPEDEAARAALPQGPGEGADGGSPQGRARQADAEVLAERSRKGPRRSRVARGATMLLSSAAAAAFVLWAWSRNTPSPETVPAARTLAASAVEHGAGSEGRSDASEPPSPEEASWVGALADLGPRELASLLKESDEIISVRAGTLWQEVQELEDLQDTWGPRAESWDDAFQGGETSQ